MFRLQRRLPLQREALLSSSPATLRWRVARPHKNSVDGYPKPHINTVCPSPQTHWLPANFMPAVIPPNEVVCSTNGRLGCADVGQNQELTVNLKLRRVYESGRIMEIRPSLSFSSERWGINESGASINDCHLSAISAASPLDGDIVACKIRPRC